MVAPYATIRAIQLGLDALEARRLELEAVDPGAVIVGLVGLRVVGDAQQDLVLMRYAQVAQVLVQFLGIGEGDILGADQEPDAQMAEPAKSMSRLKASISASPFIARLAILPLSHPHLTARTRRVCVACEGVFA